MPGMCSVARAQTVPSLVRFTHSFNIRRPGQATGAGLTLICADYKMRPIRCPERRTGQTEAAAPPGRQNQMPYTIQKKPVKQGWNIMADEDSQPDASRYQQYVGLASEPRISPPLEAEGLRRFVQAIMDPDPAYYDPEAAARSK